MYVCKQTFCKLYGKITWKFVEFRIRNFQGIIFIWTQTYGDFQICISVPLRFLNIAKIVRTPFLIEHLWWLLLERLICFCWGNCRTIFWIFYEKPAFWFSFTNIPLEETIGIYSNTLFENAQREVDLWKTEFKELLSIATKESYFIFKLVSGWFRFNKIWVSFHLDLIKFTKLLQCRYSSSLLFWEKIHNYNWLFRLSFKHFSPQPFSPQIFSFFTLCLVQWLRGLASWWTQGKIFVI